MRRIHLALPVIGLLLGGGAALAATGTGGTAPGTANGAANAMATSGRTATAGASSGKFATEGEAAKTCGATNVVWANTGTKVFHVQGDQYFGHTKRGAFMCKATATADGFHQSGQTAHKG